MNRVRRLVGMGAVAFSIGVPSLGEVPDFMASERGYSGLIWMSEDYLRDEDGSIDWEKLSPNDAQTARRVAQSNKDLSRDDCYVALVVDEYNPGNSLAQLIENASHVVSGHVIAQKQGFMYGEPTSIYEIEPDLTFKSTDENLTAPFLVRLAMARIPTPEGPVCRTDRAPEDGHPVAGARLVLFMSDLKRSNGLWHVATAAVFFQNPGASVSPPFDFKDVEDLDSLEDEVVKELERGAR
ncbi:MAG: hypothetical protein AAF560_18730 [Acidobacteriota bacterium]